MIEQLTSLWSTLSHRSFAVLLRARHPDIYAWVLSLTDDSFPTFNERVFWVLNQQDIICEYGSRKSFVPAKQLYGFCNSANICKCHRDSISKRVSSTTVFGTDAFLLNRARSWKEAYGVDNPQKLDAYKIAASTRAVGRSHSASTARKYLDDGFSAVTNRVADTALPLFNVDEYVGSGRQHQYKWLCIKCGAEIQSHIDYGTVPRCTSCYPKSVSNAELELRAYLDTLGISYVTNTKDVIAPFELDIYIPSLKIAIEHNGVYWHSSHKKSANYHVDKYLSCKAAGVHLIQIFEDQWITKKDIVKSRLRNVTGTDLRIYARKCTVALVSGKDTKLFLEKYHIQGHVSSSINVGLFINSTLTAIMTFGKSRFNNTQEFELLRYCSNSTVVGGASKLFTYFLRAYSPSSIVSYADRCWSNGKLYKTLGFENVTSNNSNTGVFYVKNGVRYHRSALTKQALVSKGADARLTADEILNAAGYLKIHNCGNYKFVYQYIS